jgi:two-component system, OmpR family, sensor histidine kinase SenX3
MRLPAKERFLGSGSVAILTIVLLTLALLQYRWSGEVSQAASTRMQASLETSIRGFKHDFYQELGVVCFPFQTSFVSNPDWNRYARRYDEWLSSDLVSNIFVWQTDRGKAFGPLRLNLTTKQFERVQWPLELTSFRDQAAAAVNRSDSVSSHTPQESFLGYRLEGSLIPDAGVNRLAWEIDQTIPALLHPLVQFATKPGQQDGSEARIIGWVIIEINSETLRTRLLPELVQRYFSGRNGPIYNVAIIEGQAPGTVIYSSNPDFGSGHNSVDAVQDLMSNPLPFQNPTETETPVRRQGVPRDSGAPIVFPSWGTYRPGGPPILQVLRYSPGEREWQLLVRNRQGSLESMVAGLRRRTLIISFSVLLLLAASMAMLFVTSHRAHRLGKLQVDFVASVSHELRTPLAVICSTADNLADGVVEGKKQVMRYGGVIRNQAHQLADLVERILLFAALRGDALPYSFRPLQVSEVVERALTNMAGMLAAAGITVDRRFDANLPFVMGDMDALVQCMQNLLTNAAKYGDDGWIGVWATVNQNGGQPLVELGVQDRGSGIEPAELDHIFEPFYRGTAAAAKQIRGTGLGLALAKSVADAMRGKLTVKSTVGVGSTFTLHLPALKADRTGQLAVKPSKDTDLVNS